MLMPICGKTQTASSQLFSVRQWWKLFIWSIWKYDSLCRAMKIPASDCSSLIQRVLKTSWLDLRLSCDTLDLMYACAYCVPKLITKDLVHCGFLQRFAVTSWTPAPSQGHHSCCCSYWIFKFQTLVYPAEFWSLEKCTEQSRYDVNV